MEEEASQPQSAKSSTFLYLIIGLLMGVIIVGAMAVVVYIRFISPGRLISNQVSKPKPKLAVPEMEATGAAAPADEVLKEDKEVEVAKKRVAYIDNYNIWVMNADGSNKTQLTFDGAVETRYAGIAFKDSKNLSYIKCLRSENCNQIYTKNLTTGESSLDVEISADDYYYLSNIVWSGDGQDLAYMYTDPDQNECIYVKQGGEERLISEIELQLGGRGGSFDDARYPQFSPDGGKLLVVYTFNLPLDEPSIFVFDVSSGAQLLSLGTVAAAWSTHAFFIDNQEVGFKRGNKIMSININTSAETVLVTTANNLNPVLSPDGNFIAFWTYTDADSAQLHLFDVASSTFKLGDDMSNPQWLSNQTLIVFTTGVCGECMFNYEITGLAKFDWAAKAKTPLLISGTVSVFRISP